MNSYVKKVFDIYQTDFNPEYAQAMQAYMKNNFTFFGIKTSLRRNLSKDMLTKSKLPAISDIPDIIKELWQLPQREFQYFGQELLIKTMHQLFENTIYLYEYIIINKSWWDTVDAIASNLIGFHFRQFPATQEQFLPRWRQSDNFWLRRTALLFQLKYKKITDKELLHDIISENMTDKEFFIRKAIGWILREFAKTDPDWVINICHELPLSNLSNREALKNLLP